MHSLLHRSALVTLLLASFAALRHSSYGAEKAPKPPPPPPPRYLEPGDTRRDVASQKVRGELLSYDPATRAGTFKATKDGATVSFTALPHVVCQHHGVLGDMNDYRIGERLRFVLHEGKDGQWNRLGVVAEELTELIIHKEAYFVDKIETDKGILHCTRRSRQSDNVVWLNMIIHTDKDTRYWKQGGPDAAFADITVGMPLLMKTHHGTGLYERIAWDILLDDVSVTHFAEEQRRMLQKRLLTEGFSGYVDSVKCHELCLTLFPEVMDAIIKGRVLKPHQAVQIALAGTDRTARGDRLEGQVTGMKPFIKNGNYVCELTLKLTAPPPADFKPASVVRVWPQGPVK